MDMCLILVRCLSGCPQCYWCNAAAPLELLQGAQECHTHQQDILNVCEYYLNHLGFQKLQHAQIEYLCAYQQTPQIGGMVHRNAHTPQWWAADPTHTHPLVTMSSKIAQALPLTIWQDHQQHPKYNGPLNAPTHQFKHSTTLFTHRHTNLAQPIQQNSTQYLLRYCRNVHPMWVKFNSKDTKESKRWFEFMEY